MLCRALSVTAPPTNMTQNVPTCLHAARSMKGAADLAKELAALHDLLPEDPLVVLTARVRHKLRVTDTTKVRVFRCPKSNKWDVSSPSVGVKTGRVTCSCCTYETTSATASRSTDPHCLKADCRDAYRKKINQRSRFKKKATP